MKLSKKSMGALVLTLAFFRWVAAQEQKSSFTAEEACRELVSQAENIIQCAPDSQGNLQVSAGSEELFQQARKKSFPDSAPAPSF